MIGKNCKCIADCQIQSDVAVIVFTDRAYAFQSTHTWGPVWRSCHFTTAAGTPTAHKTEIVKLFALTHLQCAVTVCNAAICGVIMFIMF